MKNIPVTRRSSFFGLCGWCTHRKVQKPDSTGSDVFHGGAGPHAFGFHHVRASDTAPPWKTALPGKRGSSRIRRSQPHRSSLFRHCLESFESMRFCGSPGFRVSAAPGMTVASGPFGGKNLIVECYALMPVNVLVHVHGFTELLPYSARSDSTCRYWHQGCSHMIIVNAFNGNIADLNFQDVLPILIDGAGFEAM